MESLRRYIIQNKKDVVIKLIFSRLTLIPILIFVAYIITNESLLLVILGAFILFYCIVTIPRWRTHLKDQYDYASRFAELLELKNEFLINCLQLLYQNELSRNVYWINFKIDSSSFQIDLDTYSIDEERSIDSIEKYRNEIKELLVIEPLLIKELRKQGWSADDKLELSLELIKLWFSDIWNNTIASEVKIRSTFSVKDRTGFFNLKTNKWEDLNMMGDQPLEVRQYRVHQPKKHINKTEQFPPMPFG
jgi:hypothetical protein